jgi:hypothetical protein
MIGPTTRVSVTPPASREVLIAVLLTGVSAVFCGPLQA